MSNTYRIAIVGIGAIAKMHALAIRDIPNATLVAGSCRSEDKGRAFTTEFGGNWHADYNQMLETEKPDLITICTPSGAHLEPALAAISRGIAVLCEKPLEITTDRCDQIISAAASANVPLGGIFPQRFNPVVQTLADAAKQQRFGNLALVNSYVPWWRDDAYYSPDRWQGKLALDGGGAMMNQSIHGVDAVQWLASLASTDQDPATNPVQSVSAFTAKRSHDPNLIEVEDTAVAILRFRNGALGQLLGSTSMYPGSLKRLQIGGQDGTAEILEDELVTYQFRNQQPQDAQTLKQFSSQTSHGGGAADPMAINYGLHTANIAAFINSIDSNSPFQLTGNEARKAVAIIQALYKSAATGQTVEID